MPPTRKTSGGRQATLSFNHRVTKPSVARTSAKEVVLEKAATAVKKEEVEKAVTRNTVPEEAEEAEEEEEETQATTRSPRQAKDEAAEAQERTGPATAPTAPKETPAERAAVRAADAVPEAQVRRYWRAIEAQDMARRVHQDGLGLGEKVLRYFDVSSQYGPCTGIPRKRRWLRALRLGLEPPIEVLAVLLREEAKGVADADKSAFDAILNPEVVA